MNKGLIGLKKISRQISRLNSKRVVNSGTILNIVSLQARWCRFRSKAGNRRDLQAGQPTYRFQQTAISLQYLSL